MSYFSTALQSQADRHRLSQSGLAAKSHLSKSYVSRLFSGDIAPSDEHLVALLKTFSADPTAQAELISALCMDIRQIPLSAGIPGASQVEIRVKQSPAKDEAALQNVPPAVPLAQETEKALDWLRRQCPLNSDLEKHLIGYARLLGMK